MTKKIAVLPGDGIGPEIIGEALRLLSAVAEKHGLDLSTEEAPVGGIAYDQTGHPLPPDTLALCKASDAVLLGAVGGPKWDTVQPASLRPEVGALLPLRKELGLFANLRPVTLFPALAAASSLKRELIGNGLDLLVVRELTGGIYFGQPKERSSERAVDTCVYTRPEIERIAQVGFKAAQKRQKRLVSVDKANVLETSRLWREVITEIAADYPDVELSHLLVDNCAMQLVKNPSQFDVIVTENMFGDILSDEAAMLTGSLGMLPSASLGASGEREGGTAFGLYEPIHGSAPDIAGKGIANPLAAFLSVALLLRYSLGEEAAAAGIEGAVGRVLEAGLRTGDIALPGELHVGSREMSDAVIREVKG